MHRLKARPGAGREGGAAQHSAADAAQKKRLEDKMLEHLFSFVAFCDLARRQSLRQQLQETDSLFQSTKSQQDEYLKKIACLEEERRRLRLQIAELEETNRDLITHLASSRCSSPQLHSRCCVTLLFHCPQDIV